MAIWDLIISGGTIYIIKSVLQLLEANKHILIGGLEGDGILVGLGELEKGPFGIIDYISKNQMGEGDESETTYPLKLEFLNKMRKISIRDYPIDKYEYDRLKVHYWNIHEPILKFWSEPQKLRKDSELMKMGPKMDAINDACLLYTSPSPRDRG